MKFLNYNMTLIYKKIMFILDQNVKMMVKMK